MPFVLLSPSFFFETYLLQITFGLFSSRRRKILVFLWLVPYLDHGLFIIRFVFFKCWFVDQALHSFLFRNFDKSLWKSAWRLLEIKWRPELIFMKFSSSVFGSCGTLCSIGCSAIHIRAKYRGWNNIKECLDLVTAFDIWGLQELKTKSWKSPWQML